MPWARSCCGISGHGQASAWTVFPEFHLKAGSITPCPHRASFVPGDTTQVLSVYKTYKWQPQLCGHAQELPAFCGCHILVFSAEDPIWQQLIAHGRRSPEGQDALGFRAPSSAHTGAQCHTAPSAACSQSVGHAPWSPVAVRGGVS